ncbi:MAG TPA: carboxylesterase/lipase family protein, partial [Gemmatimonadales bacterium]|nr:carboxylesterase/lipase family protein [Gemmatimonadales bacterium]
MKGNEKNERSGLGRRAWMKAVAGGAAATGVGYGSAKKPFAGAPASGETLIVVSDTNAIVETTVGKVQGFTRNGIQTFRGIPYAGTTAGAARFLPPSKPAPWKETRSALWYGKTCPQEARGGWESDAVSFLFQWDDGQPGEDCLRVNVWSPGLDGKKRPVMVWLHGGGFQAGSGQEQPAYNGENLARRGDVVVVSVNHRLGVLGYLNLAGFGGKYADSGNAGMLDLVAALEWVRDNIANFGGDPGNVTIFGQSGGGCKVTTLMTMPAAKGLFHKAVVQSGSLSLALKPDVSAQLADEVVAALGLGRDQVDKIHEVPVSQLIDAGAKAMAKLSPPPPPGGPFRLPKVMWGPTLDGKTLPSVPFDPAAPEISAAVPMMIGTVLHEFNAAMGNPKAEEMTVAELKEQLTKIYGDKAPRILEAARKIYPEQKPVALSAIIGAAMFRQGAVEQCERKAAQNAAPVYMYQFLWETPVMNGRPRAFHCAEIPFVFYNTDVSAFCTGGGAAPRALAAKVSDAWISFARKGDPNHPGLPQWPKFSKESAPVMLFNTACEVKNDY